jgi:hypothetical protein
MQGLSTREGQLASIESSQLKDYAKRWFSSSDASNAENQSVSESMRIVASDGISSSENYSARDSKSTDTHTNLGIGTGGLLGLSASTGTSARDSTDVAHDQSTGTSKSYNEALEEVRNYAKTHDLRSSLGTSESASENLQKTWREQEQVAIDRSNTAQKMQSIQQQQSYVSQNSASINSNYNDKVLEATATKHGLSNKAEALEYLNTHQHEGKQIRISWHKSMEEASQMK